MANNLLEISEKEYSKAKEHVKSNISPFGYEFKLEKFFSVNSKGKYQLRIKVYKLVAQLVDAFDLTFSKTDHFPVRKWESDVDILFILLSILQSIYTYTKDPSLDHEVARLIGYKMKNDWIKVIFKLYPFSLRFLNDIDCSLFYGKSIGDFIKDHNLELLVDKMQLSYKKPGSVANSCRMYFGTAVLKRLNIKPEDRALLPRRTVHNHDGTHYQAILYRTEYHQSVIIEVITWTLLNFFFYCSDYSVISSDLKREIKSSKVLTKDSMLSGGDVITQRKKFLERIDDIFELEDMNFI